MHSYLHSIEASTPPGSAANGNVLWRSGEPSRNGTIETLALSSLAATQCHTRNPPFGAQQQQGNPFWCCAAVAGSQPPSLVPKHSASSGRHLSQPLPLPTCGLNPGSMTGVLAGKGLLRGLPSCSCRPLSGLRPCRAGAAARHSTSVHVRGPTSSYEPLPAVLPPYNEPACSERDLLEAT